MACYLFKEKVTIFIVCIDSYFVLKVDQSSIFAKNHIIRLHPSLRGKKGSKRMMSCFSFGKYALTSDVLFIYFVH